MGTVSMQGLIELLVTTMLVGIGSAAFESQQASNGFDVFHHLMTIQTVPPYDTSTTIAYPASFTYNSTPSVVVALYHIKWQNHLGFEIEVTGGQTSLVLRVKSNKSDTLISLGFKFLLLNNVDAIISQQQTFEYSQVPSDFPAGQDQVIEVTNHKLYNMPVMVGFENHITGSLIGTLPTINLEPTEISSIGFDCTVEVPAGSNFLISFLKMRLLFVRLVLPQSQFYITTIFSMMNGPISPSLLSLVTQLEDDLNSSTDSVYYGLHIPSQLKHPSVNDPNHLQIMIAMNGYIYQVNANIWFFSLMMKIGKCNQAKPYFSNHQDLCVEKCPPKQTYNIDYYCQECQYPCQECSGTTFNCTDCPIGSILYYNQTTDFYTCICPPSKYGSPDNCQLCNDAMKDCITCLSATECTQCYEGLNTKSDKSGCQCRIGTPTTNAEGNTRCVTAKKTEKCPQTMIISGYGCVCPEGTIIVDGKCI